MGIVRHAQNAAKPRSAFHKARYNRMVSINVPVRGRAGFYQACVASVHCKSPDDECATIEPYILDDEPANTKKKYNESEESFVERKQRRRKELRWQVHDYSNSSYTSNIKRCLPEEQQIVPLMLEVDKVRFSRFAIFQYTKNYMQQSSFQVVGSVKPTLYSCREDAEEAMNGDAASRQASTIKKLQERVDNLENNLEKRVGDIVQGMLCKLCK